MVDVRSGHDWRSDACLSGNVQGFGEPSNECPHGEEGTPENNLSSQGCIAISCLHVAAAASTDAKFTIEVHRTPLFLLKWERLRNSWRHVEQILLPEARLKSALVLPLQTRSRTAPLKTARKVSCLPTHHFT